MAEKKEKEEKPWRKYEADDYQAFANNMVHFSFKATNSNARAGGIRVSQNRALNLPYISLRTLLNKGIQVDPDYTGDAAKNGPIARQMEAAMENNVTVPPDEKNDIQAIYRSAINTGAEVGCECLDSRLRQILIPKNGTYVVLTPLRSAGLMKVISQRVQDHDDPIWETRKLRSKIKKGESKEGLTLGDVPEPTNRTVDRTFLGFGGANPQNVGRHIRDTQRPLFFDVPTENPDIKGLYSLYYKGINLVPPKNLMIDYRTWRTKAALMNNGTISGTLKIREEEAALVQGIAAAIVQRGENAYQNLFNKKALLPAGSETFVCPEVDPVIQGVMCSSLRQSGWAKTFSIRLATLIANYDFHDAQGGLGMSSDEIGTLANWIREGLS